MSLANLCNRLVVNRAPLKPTNSRARGSHLADLREEGRPAPSTLVLDLNTASFAGALDSPKASPVPSDVAVGAATPVVAVIALTALPEQAATPFFGGVSAPTSSLSLFVRTERCDHKRSLSLPHSGVPPSRNRGV